MNKYMQLIEGNEHIIPLDQKGLVWALLAVAQAMYDTGEFHRDVEEMKREMEEENKTHQTRLAQVEATKKEMKKEALMKAVITTGKRISISEPVYVIDLDNV